MRIECDGMVRVSHGTHALSVPADRVREPWDAVIAERDRLRAAIHSLRDDNDLVDFVSAGWVAERLDAILDGTEAERAAAESRERDAVRALVKAGGKS
ncbi:MAG: hypothetical protein MUE69_33315 [Myxococcota bacterium]|nr:hypothetical protein [Myxococcota bacterium]